MPEVPRGTVTLLFTDIEGTIRLWQTHHEAMVTAYARHDPILREANARHGALDHLASGSSGPGWLVICGRESGIAGSFSHVL
jgi:class 3 adenylate cyclase